MQLQVPICAFDAKTGILCSECDSKLRSGQIKDADLQASKALLQAGGGLHGAARLVRSFRVEGNYVLELDGPGLTAFRSSPEALAQVEKSLGARVWLARASSSNREFIEDLLHPAKMLALDTVWLPDGTKVARAIVAGKLSRRAQPLEVVRGLAKEARGIDLVVEPDGRSRFPEMITARQ